MWQSLAAAQPFLTGILALWNMRTIKAIYIFYLVRRRSIIIIVVKFAMPHFQP